MDLIAAPKSELIRIIYEQADHIKALETQIAELRSHLKDQGPKDKEPLPSWVKPMSSTHFFRQSSSFFFLPASF